MNQLRQIQDMGCHIVLDFTDVQNIDLSDICAIKQIFTNALSRTDCNVVSQSAKVFEDGQVSMIYLLSESHMSYHAWPSEKSVTIDFYNCGSNARRNCINFEEVLCDALGWENCSCTMILPRGNEAKLIINDYIHKSDIFKGLSLISRTKSQYQDIRVYNSYQRGKVLTIDGKIQMSSEFQNDYANDMCSSVIYENSNYQNVLVLGGGDLQVARNLHSQYPNIQNITVVEFDEQVMDVCQKHFPELDLSEEMKQKINIKIEEGYQFLKDCEGKQTFDAIIVEYTENDSNGISKLQPKEFYQTLLSCLKPGCSFSQLLGSDQQTHEFLKTIENSGFDCDIDFFYTNQLGGQKQVAVVHQKKDQKIRII